MPRSMALHRGMPSRTEHHRKGGAPAFPSRKENEHVRSGGTSGEARPASRSRHRGCIRRQHSRRRRRVASCPARRDRGLLGANGAGKSTTLKAISGLAQADRARITRGSVRLNGAEIAGTAPNLLASRGIVHVLEGRHVFRHLTVEENLHTGTFSKRRSRREAEVDLDRIYAWFPRLKVKHKVLAGLTSGGEQQMLAIGRALLTRPDLVLLDEPSMGLAPILVGEFSRSLPSSITTRGCHFSSRSRMSMSPCVMRTEPSSWIQVAWPSKAPRMS